ncbi:WD40/YVTN/BNR-like repeat-containing protein [Thermogemmatispora onikobensis]|uniref:WD40/YVTN/BNR-like repeat-containing protein n=1 Tax=Thermogemmatispora onikobensis TaxID=732234 RepID=UPI0008535073|nr:hypothetical protein [Thermogemmatispora onikobensis]
MKTFLAITSYGLAAATGGQHDAWSVEMLLDEQAVTCLAVDPLNPQVLYVGTRGNGVLCSNDGGRTWRPAGLAGYFIKALAASPTQPGTVYAGTKPARVFVSHNSGASWTELVAFRRIRSRWFWFTPAEKPHSAYVQAIALSPTDPKTIVVGVEFGAVVQSRDGGHSWTGHRRGALRDCHSLAFHVSNGSWVYEAGGTGAGVSVSRDAGVTWTQPREGLDRHYGWAVAADPACPEVWYASLSPSPGSAHSEHNAQAVIARSVGDAPWQLLAGGLPQPLNHMPYALLTDPAAPGHVYAGLANGEVWHSTHYGESWRRLPVQFENIHRTLVLLSSGKADLS